MANGVASVKDAGLDCDSDVGVKTAGGIVLMSGSSERGKKVPK